MQPLPPTVEAFEKRDRVGLPDAAAVLQRLGRRALAEVPECVGLSLTLVDDGITLTLVSSSLDVAPFGGSSSAAGVQSTLSLSISDGRSIVGGINLYAGVPNAFDGHV